MAISYESAFRRTTMNLYNFVALLVTDIGPEIDNSEGRVSVSLTRHEQVLNLCQDIIAAVTKCQRQNIQGHSPACPPRNKK